MSAGRLAFTPRGTQPEYRSAGVRVGDTVAHVTAWADGRVTVEIRTQDRTGAHLSQTYYPAGHPRGNRVPSRALLLTERAEGAMDLEEIAG